MGTEMKNVICSRLGTMLYLDIQKDKETMKTLTLQKYIGSNAACMKRLMMATKGCGKMTSNDTYFYDIWFNRIRMDDEVMAEGVDYCGASEDDPKGFLYSHIIKVGESLAMRFISCCEDHPKSSWLYTANGYLIQKKLGRS